MTLPLPFLYESTGVETFFRDNRDPQPRSRRLFTLHRPETLAEWLSQPDTLRGPLRQMPQRFPLIADNLWPAQVEAVTNLERSFAADYPRALIQMATGSGKTFTAVNSVYRLIKHAKARRVLFFDRKPASETPWTKQLWIYDLRTNQNFTLKTRTLARPDLDEEGLHSQRKWGKTRGLRNSCRLRLFRRFTVEVLVVLLRIGAGMVDNAVPMVRR